MVKTRDPLPQISGILLATGDGTGHRHIESAH
jgi:hypothetical protein